jgi:transposase-like protein
VTRIVCPHCGEYERYEQQSLTAIRAVYFCKSCRKFSDWVRVSDGWRLREGVTTRRVREEKE